jgi:sugar/nucleoside kinase (ribokinase family)
VRPVGIVGHLSRDLFGGGRTSVGGGAYHCARALRALGRPGVVVTKVSEAERPLLEEVVRLGVPVRWRTATSIPAFALEYEGEARSMALEALGDSWTAEEAAGWVHEALQGIVWVHVAPLSRSDFPPETLAVLARGRHLSFDAHGLVRVPVEGPLAVDADYDPALLEHVQILKLAEDEALLVAGGIDEQSLRMLGVPEVVVTLGARGSIVLADGLAEHVPARPLPGDPTGAGDVFATAYLAARAGGAPPVPAARRATALAGHVLSGSA